MDILDIYLKFREVENVDLVGGFNPSEKYSSNWISSPNRGENKRYLKNHHLEMFHQLLLDWIIFCQPIWQPNRTFPTERSVPSHLAASKIIHSRGSKPVILGDSWNSRCSSSTVVGKYESSLAPPISQGFIPKTNSSRLYSSPLKINGLIRLTVHFWLVEKSCATNLHKPILHRTGCWI